MCQRIKCSECGKPTWAGCGRHIEGALAGVPKEARCKCGETPASEKAGSQSESDPSAAPRRKLFGIF
ncbi:MAG TPA: hypothetical protein VMV18_02920 [bacterium]|nr:hypothetical protein [bacterium]